MCKTRSVSDKFYQNNVKVNNLTHRPATVDCELETEETQAFRHEYKVRILMNKL